MLRSRRFKIALAAVIIAAGCYGAVRLWKFSAGIPQDFTDSRLQGALIAQNIVNLSNQSVSDLTKINDLDSSRKFADALKLTENVIKQGQEIRDQAVALSREIEKMTKALSDIDSLGARQAALESITNRLALISRLINYSGYLGQLLDTLRNRFAGNVLGDHQVAQLVGQINAEVQAINSFNSQAGQAMDRFDKIVNR